MQPETETHPQPRPAVCHRLNPKRRARLSGHCRGRLWGPFTARRGSRTINLHRPPPLSPPLMALSLYTLHFYTTTWDYPGDDGVSAGMGGAVGGAVAVGDL